MHFTYFAKKVSGEEMRGVMDAKDRFDLSKLLRQQGYTLVFCKEDKIKDKSLMRLLSFLETVSLSEKIFFSRNLAVMVSAGVSIAKALEILARQTKNKKFKVILGELGEGIKKGNSLSEGMKQHPRVFSTLFSAMVKVGEETGRLSESLILISEQMEKDHTLRKKIKGAMIYPSIVITAMVLIGILMMIYVVPTLTATFEELEVQLPLSTRIIIMISNFFVNHTILFAIVLGIAVVSIFSILRSAKGKKIFNIIILRAPLFSPLVKKVNSARTSRTLASLISAGVDVLEALNITKEVLQNDKFKEVLEQARNDIQKGVPISESFKKASNLYPILVGEMMAVGEETGKLTDMLLRLADFYEEEVAEATKNISTVIEPVLMVIIGAAVGFFAVSMIKPMYSMVSGL
ncbi:type II secretion system F family protein [Patescibacteria group bacterium]|nr:type II secretion system F family protein [Patescibacteria group bacterium]